MKERDCLAGWISGGASMPGHDARDGLSGRAGADVPLVLLLDEQAQVDSSQEDALTVRALRYGDAAALALRHLTGALRACHGIHGSDISTSPRSSPGTSSVCRISTLSRDRHTPFVKMPRPAADYPYFDNDGLPLAFAHRGGGLG